LVSDGQAVRRMDADGGQQSALLSDPNAWIVDMARCGDRYMVLSWAFHDGTNQTGIWRTNANGSNPKQLTRRLFDQFPVCSPDGKWVYYHDSEGPHFMMRVPLEGGQPEPVPSSDIHGQYGLGSLAISPDGKRLLFDAVLTSPENLQGTIVELASISLDADAPSPAVLLQPDPRIAPPSGTGFANSMTFTPDGKAVAYIIRDKGVDNFLRSLSTVRLGARSRTSLRITSCNFTGLRMERRLPSPAPTTLPTWFCCAKNRSEMELNSAGIADPVKKTRQRARLECPPTDRSRPHTSSPSKSSPACFRRTRGAAFLVATLADARDFRR